MNVRFFAGTASVALLLGLAMAAPASAQTAPGVTVQVAPAADQTAQAAPAPAAAPAAPAAPAHPMFGPVMVSGYVEGGTNINPDSPNSNLNFGQVFDERANTFRMNQAVLTAEHDMDPNATGVDWGFKFQPMYGTDARATQTVGLFGVATAKNRAVYKWDFVEANVLFHAPIPTTGGVDLKAGIYSTPIGYEVIDATGNFFYTHSYIFNYGIPLKHTGILATFHVVPLIDVWAGIDSGVNTGVTGLVGKDNNKSASFLGGIGINSPIPNLTILALAHIGPENSTNAIVAGSPQRASNYGRQIYDVVTTYKWSDSLTLANELNVIKDDLANGASVGGTGHSGATAEGAAFYGIYTWNPSWSFGARGEVFRDDQGFFVGTETNGANYVLAENGNAALYGVGKATYSELTLGANYTPPFTLPGTMNFMVRPEVRWDHSFGMAGSAKAFDQNAAGTPTKNDQFLLSIDAIIGF